MGKRRRAREAAVQYHFWRDLQRGEGPDKIDEFWEFCPAPERVREFAQPLIEGMVAHLPDIDERIRRYCENYEFRRISAVDRNVLRLAIYEMLYRDDIPPVVSINEAIELAKAYGGADSGRFVNGILDRIRKDLDRPARERFNQPGHIFPLRAKDGGVLRRAGHTEAAVDLATMAGLQAAGVLCEILHDDGSMARLPELMEFRNKHGLRICTIQSLIAFRRKSEKLVELEQIVKMPTDYGDFDLHLYRSKLDGQHHLALVKGQIDKNKPTLVRVHSQCLTGDVFASRRCDCGNQMHAALRQIEEEGQGVLVYMRQEGRGIGLAAKIHAYKLQEEGLDTVEANAKLGYATDLRDYGLGAQILFDLGVRQFRFLTNNPKKVVGLEGYGLEMIEQVPIRAEANPHNEKYLETKKTKLGHLL